MKWIQALWKTPDRRLTVALFAFLVALLIPFAGNYGMWDPWETHYGEVAHQMLLRHDYVALFWPGSPQDRAEFWSKPVLPFWLMAIAMKIAGLHGDVSLPPSWSGAQYDGEFAVGWTVEWAARLPFILCAIACVWATWELVRRLAGRRAAFWSALILATSTQFFLIARQAMTDMAFVAPMTVALCFAGLALMLPAEDVEAELPRRSRPVGSWTFSWPHARAFYGTLAVAVLTVVPQIVLISAQVKLQIPVGARHRLTTTALLAISPWVACFVLWLWLATRATCRRQLYFHVAFLMCGVATLEKGPAGIGLPVLAVFGYLLAQGEIKRLLPPGPVADDATPTWLRALKWVWRFIARNPLELGVGLLLFIAVTFPWYHAMFIRTGMGFWNEFIGDNYINRAAGRHGDRGTFDYYLLQLAHGMFPWTAVVVGGALVALGRVLTGKTQDTRAKLRGFALSWFLVMWCVLALVVTKFHHYILPTLPALAILGGLLVDELMGSASDEDALRERRTGALAVLLVGLPVLALAARDLAMYPARLLWLFNYDYVNAPGGGRPWPSGPEWHGAYDYTTRIGVFGAFIVGASLLFGLVALWRARHATTPANPDDAELDAAMPLPFYVAVPLLAIAATVYWQPKVELGPHPLANGWILVGALAALLLVATLAPGLRVAARRSATVALVAVAVVASMWGGWVLDRFMTDVSPHWSQKHLIAHYYMERKGPEEPLIAWQLYWRGENFYTKNAIYDHRRSAADKTVFLQEHNAEKMGQYFKAHAGQRVFFIVERARFESLRNLLPAEARASLHSIDDTNNKLYLATANL